MEGVELKNVSIKGVKLAFRAFIHTPLLRPPNMEMERILKRCRKLSKWMEITFQREKGQIQPILFSIISVEKTNGGF